MQSKTMSGMQPGIQLHYLKNSFRQLDKDNDQRKYKLALNDILNAS